MNPGDDDGYGGVQAVQLRSRAKRALLFLLVLSTGLGFTASGLLYLQQRKDQKIINASRADSQPAAQALVQRVSRLMLLPANEKPTVATVSNFHKLPSQTFFKNAHNGDKVLIYAKAKTAILYDPKRNLILAVAPLAIASTGTAPGN